MTHNEMNMGGQAVIEGVMMRSEKYISVAVRKADGTIALKREENRPWGKRLKIFKFPFIRGGAVLIESVIHGTKALSWSADVAVENEDSERKKTSRDRNSIVSRLGTVITLLISFSFGLFLFFWLPLIFTQWFGFETGLVFNLVDGIFRLLMFGMYLALISMWREIRQILQYHGAEHKSIYALENDCSLTVDGARPFSTLHPRCGTSFLLIVMVVSIFVFMFLGKPETYADRIVRLLFIPVIGGISYEFIRLSGRFRDSKIARLFINPGLWLQKMTTREPDDDQLEIGIIALRSAMGETLDQDNIIHYDSNGQQRTSYSNDTSSSDEKAAISSR